MNSSVALIKQELERLRPFIKAHNGDIEFVSYENGVVRIQFKGACVSCPISSYTLKMGIEQHLLKNCSFVKSVKAVD